MSDSSQLRVASFFSGIGGFDLGFERAGMEIVFQCEKDPFARSVLRKHWPSVPLHNDITTLDPKEIPEAQIYCGGFPCQDVSLAANGKRKGLNGGRSSLFFKFTELIETRTPQWVVIENVVGLLNSQSGQDFRVVIETLDRIGYGVAWRILDAKHFGTPQRRRRVFIVGSFGNLSAATVLLDEEAIRVPIETCSRPKQTAGTEAERGLSEPHLYTIQHAAIGREHEAGPQGKGYRNDGETWTLDYRGNADAICSTDAPIGIREATGFSRRLDRRRYRALGNAVCVPLIEWIGKRIIAVQDGNIKVDPQYCPENSHGQCGEREVTHKQMPLVADNG